MIWYHMGLQHYTFNNREMRLKKKQGHCFFMHHLADITRYIYFSFNTSLWLLFYFFLCFIFRLCLISFLQLNRLQIECNIYAKQWDYVVIWSYGGFLNDFLSLWTGDKEKKGYLGVKVRTKVERRVLRLLDCQNE